LNEKFEVVKFMVVVSEEKKQLFASRPLVPRTEHSKVDAEKLKKLYFSTTTKSVFVPKTLSSNSSFSDVHKAAQRVPVNVTRRAPFWSRDMSRYANHIPFQTHFARYHQAYIPLPLEGAEINRELARTFQPDSDGSSTTTSSTVSVPQSYKTQYTDDFSSNIQKGVDYRIETFRPKVQKHIHEDDRLLYKESITHQQFQSLTGASPGHRSLGPHEIPKPTSTGFRFTGTTSYSDEFIDVSKMSYRPPEQIRGSTNSSRVYGSAVPVGVAFFKSQNGVRDILNDPCVPKMRDILFSPMTRSTTGVSDFPDPGNPYISEYMSNG